MAQNKANYYITVYTDKHKHTTLSAFRGLEADLTGDLTGDLAGDFTSDWDDEDGVFGSCSSWLALLLAFAAAFIFKLGWLSERTEKDDFSLSGD